MKPTVAVRFLKAGAELHKRIYEYCQMHATTDPRIGLCVIAPKYAALGPPSKEIHVQIESEAKEHFSAFNKRSVSMQYMDLPALPSKKNDNMQISINDFQVNYSESDFDENWQRQTLVRAMIYCPDNEDMGAWNHWYDPQVEALRLTSMLYEGLKETITIGQIRHCFSLSGAGVFSEFMRLHALNDDHIRERERKENWTLLYPEVKPLFNEQTSLFDLYVIARKKAAQSRNPKLKDLLWGFSEEIEDALIAKSDLSDETKQALIRTLREESSATNKKKYQAKRPAVCISDQECGWLIYTLLKEFESSPKHLALAETVIFIWICQHAAFSDIDITVSQILKLTVLDFDNHSLVVKINNQELPISGGVNNFLSAWIGDADRKNQRRLLPSLNYDKLEDIIQKYTVSLCGHEDRLMPRDFLGKTHPFPGARLSQEIRDLINHQEKIAKRSPYYVNPIQIKKQILNTLSKKRA